MRPGFIFAVPTSPQGGVGSGRVVVVAVMVVQGNRGRRGERRNKGGAHVIVHNAIKKVRVEKREGKIKDCWVARK